MPEPTPAGTERRVAIACRYALSPHEARVHGPATSDPTVARDVTHGAPWSVSSPPRRFQARSRLVPTEDAYPLYVVTSGLTGPTLMLPQRSPKGLRAVSALEVHQALPSTKTSVKLRLVLEAGAVEYWWDGDSWEVAADDEDDWNDAADWDAAALAAIDIAKARNGIGFRVALRTTDADQTPLFYGIEMVWDIHMTATAGDRQASQRDELVVALMKSLESIALRGNEIYESAGGTAVSYASLVQGDSKRTVVSVNAVYDSTLDPELASPLSGTYDAGARTFTLDSAVPEGNVVHVDYEYAILVTRGGDKDRFIDSLPALVLQAARTENRRWRTGYHMVLKADGTPRVVKRPGTEDLRIPLSVRAEHAYEAEAVVEQVFARFMPGGVSERRGLSLTLPSTGTKAVVWITDEVSEVAPRGDLWQTSLSLRVSGLPLWNTEAVDAEGVTEVDFDPVGQL